MQNLMKLSKVVGGSAPGTSRKPLSRRSFWHIMAFALAASLLVAVPLFADCPANETCTVGIQGSTYVVQGPCDYLEFYYHFFNACVGHFDSICIDGCTNNFTPPIPNPPPLCVSGSVVCVTPDELLQDGDARDKVEPLVLEARQHIASLRGVPDDKINLYWSRGEIRGYMFLRLLEMADATTPLSAQDQAVVNYYTGVINADRVAVATKALSLYGTWQASPCTFQVPVGDPNSYLNDPATKGPCSVPPDSPGCALGACIPAPPSADEFTEWAVSVMLHDDFNTWGERLVAGPYIGLKSSDAKSAAALEYDATFGDIAEGAAYLTAKEGKIAELSPEEQSEVEAELQEQWLDALHDVAGERLREMFSDVLVTVFRAQVDGGGQATLAETFGVETIFSDSAAAAEESIIGFATETWDTFVGPAIAAGAVIAFETWQAIESAEVPVKLQADVSDANAGKSLHDFAQTAEGRNFMLEAVVKSTMPDLIVSRLGDPTAGTAPNAGPISSSDPHFLQGSNTTLNSFVYTNWNGTVSRASVANGWFVSAADGSSDALRFLPSVPFVTATGELWRAWLDGKNFLAERQAVPVGTGQVEAAFNSCPTVLVGTGNPVALGNVCVKLAGVGSFSIQKDDDIVIAGQVRKAAGNQFLAADGFYYVQTTLPFGDPAPAAGPVTVVVHPDGDCMTASVLGSRITGFDCTLGNRISTDHGTVTMTFLVSPTVAFDLSGLTNVTFGASPFSVASSFVSNSPGAVTFGLGAGSVGCSVSSNGTVTITGAATGAASCVISASQDATNTYFPSTLSSSFHISKAKPTVSFTGAPAAAAKGAQFTVSASTNSSSTATISASGACSISGNKVTMTASTGICSMSAQWTADANYLSASATQSTATTGTQITSLISTIGTFKLSPGGSNSSFTTQLQQVMTDLQGLGGKTAACADLTIFINHVKAQSQKQLTAAQAQQLLTAAAQIAATLGCS